MMLPPRFFTGVALVVLATLAACPRDPAFIECRDNTSCERFPGGVCLENAVTGHQFCTYPDTQCPSGMRWSDLDVEESISGVCVVIAIDAGADALDASPPDALVPDADVAAPDAGIPVGMLYVPSGTFGMGCDVAVEGACPNSNELPLHSVTISSFLIDEREVSRADYQACVDAGVCLALAGQSASDLPSAAPWQNASSYCSWAGKRLPSEAEWEYAARGTDHRTYPWGNTAPTCDLAAYSVCGGGYEFVTANPAGASPFGAINMAGNAAEWTKDWYSDTYYSVSPAVDPQGPSTGTYKLVRGGSGADPATNIRTAVRSSKASTGLYGYRCAKSYP